MTALIAPRPVIIPKAKIGSGIVMILTGDFLFFDQAAGMNVALFLAVLAVNVYLLSFLLNKHNRFSATTLLFAIPAIFTLAENISWISVLLAVFGISTLAVVSKSPWYKDVPAWLSGVLWFVFTAPLRILKDVKLIRYLRARAGKSTLPGGLITWIVPFVLTGVFAFLFAMANPVMDELISSLFQMPEGEVIPSGRLLLWLGILLFVWPVFSRRKAKHKTVPREVLFKQEDKPGLFDRLLGPQTIIRSLVMFNLLFGLQTIFDFAFLWAGAQLPDGMSYAEYAHRGAYPLLFTVLLAAFFVLVTMYEGSKAENNKLIRALVYLWIGQNILLTFSSIDRLWLYVESYSLTYLRVAAMIWMGLVAIGLALILTRLWRNYSNRWLVSANLLSLVATLFICAFINFGNLVAWFNVENSAEIAGQGRLVDLRYLEKLGPQGLPALRFLDASETEISQARRQRIKRILERLDEKVQVITQRDWRAMTLRDYRLANWYRSMQNKFETSNYPEKR